MNMWRRPTQLQKYWLILIKDEIYQDYNTKMIAADYFSEEYREFLINLSKVLIIWMKLPSRISPIKTTIANNLNFFDDLF